MGDVGVGPPVQIDGSDRRAVWLSELVDEGTQTPGELAVRGLRVVGKRVLGRNRRSQVAVVVPTPAVAGTGAVVVDDHVARDPVQPCGGVGDPAVVVCQQAKQHLLGEVVGDIGTLDPARDETVQSGTHGRQRVVARGRPPYR
jgi:hypothetical protein